MSDEHAGDRDLQAEAGEVAHLVPRRRRQRQWQPRQLLAHPAHLQQAGQQVHRRLHGDDRDEPVADDHQTRGQHRLDQRHPDPQLAAPVLALAAKEQRLERGQGHAQRHADDGHRDGGGGPAVEFRGQLEDVGEPRREPRRLRRHQHHRRHQHQRRRGGAAHGVVVAAAQSGGDALGQGRDDAELHEPHVAGDRAEQQPHAGRGFAEVADDEGEQDETGRHIDGEPGVIPERVAGQDGADLDPGAPPARAGTLTNSTVSRPARLSSAERRRANDTAIFASQFEAQSCSGQMMRQAIVTHRWALAVVVATAAAGVVASSTTQPRSGQLDPLVFVSRQIPEQGSIYSATARGLAGVGAFARLQVASPGSLVCRDADGQVRTLVDGRQPTDRSLRLVDVSSADVSYDGTQVVFAGLTAGTYDRGPSGNPGAWRLFVIGLDGRDLRQLTFDDPARTDLAEPLRAIDDYDPAWLPDGRIVFASTRWPSFSHYGGARTSNLYVVDADGGRLHRSPPSATAPTGRPSIRPPDRSSSRAGGAISGSRWIVSTARRTGTASTGRTA